MTCQGKRDLIRKDYNLACKWIKFASLIVGATVNISKTQLIWTEAFQNIKEVNNKYVRILSVFTKALLALRYGNTRRNPWAFALDSFVVNKGI